VLDFDPAHHLANDRLDVLVVDVDALEAVDLLNRVYEIGLRKLFAEDGQQVVQVGRTVDECLTSANVFAFLNVDVDAARNRIFLGGFPVFAFDVDLAHALGNFAVADDAVDFADDGRILGFAGFKELDNARETAGDVLGLGRFARNLRENVARLNVIAILDHQVRARGHEVLLLGFARAVANQDGGLMLFIARRQSNDVLRKAGDFVDLLFDGDAGTQILEADRAAGFRENGERERIPFGKNLAVGDVVAVGYAETRAVHDVVALFFAALFVNDGDEAGTIHGDGSSAATFDELQVDELDDAVVARLDGGTLGNARRGTADVEGTHGELRAGFADGLRGDDADRFTEFDHAARSEVAAIAKGANTAAGFASEHGTNADPPHTPSPHPPRHPLPTFP